MKGKDLMKIALYHNSSVGGAQKTIFEQVKRLTERGHDVSEFSFTTVNDGLWDIKPYLDCSVRLLLKSEKEIRKASKLLAEKLNRSGAEVVLVHQDMFTQVPMGLADIRIPTVYFCHEPKRVLFEPYLFEEFLKRGQLDVKPFIPRKITLHRMYEQALKEKELTKKASLVLANSYFSAESIYRAYGIFARVNYSGVDTAIYYPRKVKQEKAVLHIGTSLHKNPEWSIEVVGRIPEEKRPLLWFRSNPSKPDQDYLRNYAAQLGVEIVFIGELDENEMAQLYSSAKCTLAPYLMEPFGLTVLESMACGTPVIGFKEGGLRETIRHGETGYLLERDIDSWVEMLKLILKEDKENFSAKSFQYVKENWSWESSIDRLEKILWEVKNEEKS